MSVSHIGHHDHSGDFGLCVRDATVKLWATWSALFTNWRSTMNGPAGAVVWLVSLVGTRNTEGAAYQRREEGWRRWRGR